MHLEVQGDHEYLEHQKRLTIICVWIWNILMVELQIIKSRGKYVLTYNVSLMQENNATYGKEPQLDPNYIHIHALTKRFQSHHRPSSQQHRQGAKIYFATSALGSPKSAEAIWDKFSLVHAPGFWAQLFHNSEDASSYVRCIYTREVCKCLCICFQCARQYYLLAWSDSLRKSEGCRSQKGHSLACHTQSWTFHRIWVSKSESQSKFQHHGLLLVKAGSIS